MKKIYWHDWKMPNFHINFKHQFNCSHSCCGGCCVSMVTGEDPNKVDKKLGWKDDAKTGKMIRHLKSKGYDVARLGLRDVSDSLDCCAWSSQTLTDDHVLLFGCMTDAEEASWFLFHQGIVWHNFVKWTDSPLFLLRNPIEDVLLIHK